MLINLIPPVKSFVEAIERGQTLTDFLIEARDATLDEFAGVWHDSAKMEMAMSFYLCMGTQYLLEINYHGSRLFATIARFFEQYIAAFKSSMINSLLKGMIVGPCNTP